MGYEEMWRDLLPIGRVSGGGHRRYSWTAADRECRAWFTEEAGRRGLTLEEDRNGNLFAWLDVPGERRDAVLTGSHLDSVPDGGAFDGPLGVVSALAAIDLLRERGVTPARPLGVAVFAEEEGARFGVACLGSRLLTGAIDPVRARGLRDADGVTWADAMAADGRDPEAIGPDPDLLTGIGCFVELHVEQGRALEVPVGVASAIWPHGRWRFDFTGQGNHAGTTLLRDRRDPMLPFAHTILAARDAAARHEAVATMGKVHVTPNGVNAIPSLVRAWLDTRAPDDAAVRATVAEIHAAAEKAAGEHGVEVALAEESYTEVVDFHTGLRDRLAATLGGAPVLPTGAGHDAGILSAHVPTAMLFVRNPTGVSHAPEEHAETGDCLAGVEALATVLEDLVTR
ncbi:allantoate amidohydrolase [Actinoallomurus rhizosphaericola]|uniref:allantoate amidohydrolase n=1 Tax=Actinoallomurus rhizosphaericola TaxID=2952536 RepID=UPI0020917EBB|nr:allantoate amidohydrolase [Actinoallomurus rhizosphaericola]MCO5991904.1 allantoate amidohydrolase [Actinoallomurus rhizosphaericola]